MLIIFTIHGHRCMLTYCMFGVCVIRPSKRLKTGKRTIFTRTSYPDSSHKSQGIIGTASLGNVEDDGSDVISDSDSQEYVNVPEEQVVIQLERDMGSFGIVCIHCDALNLVISGFGFKDRGEIMSCIPH